MKRADFNYDLPEGLIAKYPTEKRTESRLLVLNKNTGEISHQQFKDFINFFKPNDLLVLNNTKVIPARIYGQKTSGGKVEILVEKFLSSHHALVHCKASKRPKINQIIHFPYQLIGTIIGNQEDLLHIEFNQSIKDYLYQYGHIPLPPYLKRQDEALDKIRYQTVYAELEGSVAAPTAGLHFDQESLNLFNTAYVTLHVGAGTFQNMRVENISDHVMHSEYAEIPEETCQKIKKTKQAGRKIFAVGTTTVRTLETAILNENELHPFQGETDLFITPGFQFRSIDAMLTNFHLPETTLLMLVCAFGGKDNVMNAYQSAIENQYRFFSYGDAMLII